MLACSTFKLRATATSANPDISEPEPEPKVRKLKASSQLNKWYRARALRSGHKLERSSRRTGALEVNPSAQRTKESLSLKSTSMESDDDHDVEVTTPGKPIYMVSDGTGWTAEDSVNAALGQFDHCLVDRRCPVNTHLFSGIDDVERLLEIIKQAAKEGAMLLYTLADPSMAESAKQACKLWAPGRSFPLSDEYFQRIEAVEFTIKQDDGAMPQNLCKADIVLMGVSRTGKTPLSIYLSQKGYKVANVPIVKEVSLPKGLFEVDPEKVFGLTINPLVLQTIRKARAKSLGFNEETRSNYSEMDYVKQDLEFARRVFAQNPVWPVIEVTGKAIEETAAVILRLYHDRKHKCSMPRISKRY
ncbi:hypothetical protein CRYUN_Cryun31cG0018700 [Craigia yunnanensis]